MNVNMVYPPRPARRGRVIALHCSGGGASQWSYLAEGLGGRYEVLAGGSLCTQCHMPARANDWVFTKG